MTLGVFERSPLQVQDRAGGLNSGTHRRRRRKWRPPLGPAAGGRALLIERGGNHRTLFKKYWPPVVLSSYRFRCALRGIKSPLPESRANGGLPFPLIFLFIQSPPGRVDESIPGRDRAARRSAATSAYGDPTTPPATSSSWGNGGVGGEAGKGIGSVSWNTATGGTKWIR